MAAELEKGSNSIDLIPNGKNIRVTDNNKQEFIRKKCYCLGYSAVSEQLESLISGFNKVIPQEWIKVFSSDELEAAICGNNHIDLEDWRSHTEIKGYGKWSMTVKRFWQAMETYN